MAKIKKIKVVWLCHFGNEELSKKLGISSNLNFAPWISDLLLLFENNEQIELHVVSPNYYNNLDITTNLNGATIHLYKYKMLPLPKQFENIAYSHIYSISKVIKIVNGIAPDILHLHGSENPIYSEAVLPLITQFPTLVTIQGFVSLSKNPKNYIKQYIRWNRVRIERKINRSAKFITAATKDTREELKRFTKDAIIYDDHYPTTVPKVSKNGITKSKYDYVFYARISKEKGVEDFVKALHIIKKSKPQLKALIIGGGSSSYIERLKTKIKTLGLFENITFAGYQETQQDVFNLAIQANIYILPTHFDGIPGSIRECMFMRIPIIASAVGGIPTFNDEKECLTLSKPNDVNDLVVKIKLVEENSTRTQRLVDNAYQLITNKYDNQKIPSNMLGIYNDILRRENQNTK
ncbi:glycosyltransferase involved in cell wall biosynthesis [Dokdonia sp. Hel_I_63]|uniref:glycosyltransferase n=1 Tax=Dokdonia sp. Hel_I_63 TaxID=1249996 RepID=UPI00119B30FC|nr:glycosyltransferase [Dokdonia sp. Hel_I_63]TVZ22998.1 glycosyltransferase involved in cell wall biosynthesis [Dokdonia sp. Hel_I_63]